MLDDFAPWLAMFHMLRSETYKRQPFELLDRAGAHENDFDVFLMLDSVVLEWREEERERKRNAHGR